MTTFNRVRDIVCGIFRVHPSVVREDVTLAAVSGGRETTKRVLFAEAVFRSFGVVIENELHDCVTLGAIAEVIDAELARTARDLQAAE